MTPSRMSLFALPFVLLDAPPTLAQSLEADTGLMIGLPRAGNVDLRDFGAIIAGVRSSPSNTDWNTYDGLILVPSIAGLSDQDRAILEGLFGPEGCSTCMGTGVVTIPKSPTFPGLGAGVQVPAFPDFRGYSTGQIVTPPSQSWVYSGGPSSAASHATVSWTPQIETVADSILRLLEAEAASLGGDCMKPFVGDASAGVQTPWGSSVEFDIVAPSEIFSRDRPDMWFGFTVSVQETSSDVAWGGGVIDRRWFIVDALKYSWRGICIFGSGAPLPGQVLEILDGANQQEVELEIASFLSQRLGSPSQEWIDFFGVRN